MLNSSGHRVGSQTKAHKRKHSGSAFPPVSSSTTVYVSYQLQLSTAQIHMQTYSTESLCRHRLSLWKQCTSYSPDTGRVCQEAKGTWKVLHRKKLERLLRYTEHLETKDFMQANKSCLLCDLGSSYFCTLIHMPCHSVDQVGLEPRPPLASHKLAFKARTSMKRYY